MLEEHLRELTGFTINVDGICRRLKVIHDLTDIEDHDIWATAKVVHEQIGKRTPKPVSAEDWRMRIADFVAINKKASD